jgi:hypothetical protein
MFTHADFKGAERAGCAFVIVFILILVALGFWIGRCTHGYSIKVQTVKEVGE